MKLTRTMNFARIMAVFTVMLAGQLVSWAQTNVVTLDEKNITVKQLLKVIEERSGYSFAYVDSDFDLTRRVSIKAANREISSIISEVLPQMSMEIKGQNIVLVKALPKASAGITSARTISGQVYDENNDPVIGAVVMVKGTQNAAITDLDGRYSIEASGEVTLNASCLGYFTKDITVIAKNSKADILLQQEMLKLDDVVVVGYETQKRVNLTGSVSSIETGQLATQPITQATTALQGMAAGVSVTTAGGAPGADNATIRIRGLGTFGGSSASPLILVDGVQGDLNAVDASEIESISVLKDAASSAIYGSRAANGVILVTTKRAKKGGKSSITYRGYAGWQSPTSLPSLVNPEEYMTLAREATENDGGVSIYTDDYIANYRKNNYLDPDNYPITDWQRRLLNGNGFMHNHVLTLSATSDKIRNITTLGYLSQNGIIKFTDYSRFNLRNNMNVDILKNLHFRLDLSGSFGRRHSLQNQSGVFNFMNARDPLMLAQWSDGNYAPFTGGTTNILPIIEKGLGGNIQRDYLNLTGAISLTWEPFKWLSLDGTIAPRYKLNSTHNFTDLITYYADAYGTVSPVTNAEYSSLTESKDQVFYGNYQFKAKFHWDIKKKHDLGLLLGTSYETMSERTLSGYRQEFPYPQYDVLSAGAANEFQEANGARYEWALLSYFIRANYNYKERYLFEANVRYDGSSRFAKRKRWGVFPSFSAAWRITEEDWVKPITKTMTEMKIRASYGELGNQNIGSDYYPTIQTLTISSIFAGETLYPIVGLNNLANPDITWETSKMTDIGVDIAFWNKLTFTADWYYKTTDGILMQLAIPQSIGLTPPYQNAGSVRNVGWEAALEYSDSAGDFTWNAGANLSDVVNTITDMKGTYSQSGDLRNQEGSSINSIYGLYCYGIIKTQEQADWVNANQPQYNIISKPGDLVYEDFNKDGKVDDNDRQIIGSCIPRYTYGFHLGAGWKGLNLTAQFQGVGKADAYLSGYFTQPCVQGGTFRKEHLDRWTPATPDGRFPRMSYATDNTLNTKTSTFWMGNAAYFRLKNIQLSYSLPKRIINRAKIQDLMLYANASNLFTISNYYQGYDPENMYSGGTDGATTGAFASNYPLVKTFTFGVQIKF